MPTSAYNQQNYYGSNVNRGHEISKRITVARWPNFRTNNLKQAPKSISWLVNIWGGRKMAHFFQKWQKRGRQISNSNLQGKLTVLCSFSQFFINNKADKYWNQEEFLTRFLK
jgi:hypothetical protein